MLESLVRKVDGLVGCPADWGEERGTDLSPDPLATQPRNNFSEHTAGPQTLLELLA